MGSFAIGAVVGAFVGLAVGGLIAIVAWRLSHRRSGDASRAQRQAELGTLTGGLAHEIKNPLSTIALNLQLLREDLSPRDLGPQQFARLSNRLATVQRETGRLGEILDDFRRYAGRIELEKRPVDLRRMFEELADFIAPQAQLQRVQVRVGKCDGGEELIGVVPLDDRLIKQALLNLVINALQAMPEQGGDITLSAKREGGNRVLILQCQRFRRIGISPDKLLSKIFDAYYSAPRKGGTGLGSRHHQVASPKSTAATSTATSSSIGKGSVFSIDLPTRLGSPCRLLSCLSPHRLESVRVTRPVPAALAVGNGHYAVDRPWLKTRYHPIHHPRSSMTRPSTRR